MMRWLKDKKKERRSSSANYDGDENEDDYGFEKDKLYPASKSPSTRRQLPPTPATPEEKSPHIYEEIPDMLCTSASPAQASTDSHRGKIAVFGKKAFSSGKSVEPGLKGVSVGAGSGGRDNHGNKYTSDVSAAALGGVSKSAGRKKRKMEESDGRGQHKDEEARRTPQSLHRNGTPEVHCDVIIKDTHCEILLSRKPKNAPLAATHNNTNSSSNSQNTNTISSGANSTNSTAYPLLLHGMTSSSSWSQQQQPDIYVGPQSGKPHSHLCPRDRRASVDVHSSTSKFTSAFSLASSSTSSSATGGPVIGSASAAASSSVAASTSFSSSTSRLNSLGASSSLSVLNFTEPHPRGSHPQPGYAAQHKPQQQPQQHNPSLYQCMHPPAGGDEIIGAGESAGSVTSSAKGVETYTTASNFIARPAVLPFQPLPGAKDPCVEAFGRRLSSSSSSNDGAYASIQDSVVQDSAHHTAPGQNFTSPSGFDGGSGGGGAGGNSVTYASIQDAADGPTEVSGSGVPPGRGHVTYASIQDQQQQQQLHQSRHSRVCENKQHQKLFYGAQNHINQNLVGSLHESKSCEDQGALPVAMRTGIIHARSPSDSSSCTYASVSFPVEPKHYNTITDISSSRVLTDDSRETTHESSGTSRNPAAQQAFNATHANDQCDDIYCGVGPYRVKPGGFDSNAVAGHSRNAKRSAEKRYLDAPTKDRPYAQQHSLYADISLQHNESARTKIYSSIDLSGSSKHTNFDNSNRSGFIRKNHSIHSNNNNNTNNIASPQLNDLHRYAVDRGSFHIDFCTCSDDHSSSCGLSGVSSSKPRECFGDESHNKESKCVTNDKPSASTANNFTDNAPSSCKDCGRLIRQITYSESYSDETYEHAYSSRLLTRKGRRYSSPDITSSEISNSEFFHEPPSYHQYRASPSWSRRSPANEAGILRDDTWASSPRSDDGIPPAYGALDDNGFVSNHYERWSPTYASNRSIGALDATRGLGRRGGFTPYFRRSPTSGQGRSCPWLTTSPLAEDLLKHSDNHEALAHWSDDSKAGAAFFTPTAHSGAHTEPSLRTEGEEDLEKNSRPRSLVEKLRVALPEPHPEVGRERSAVAALAPKSNAFSGLFGKAAKTKSCPTYKAGDQENSNYDVIDADNHSDQAAQKEQNEEIPEKNTKKLAKFFQSLSSNKEALVGTVDNLLMSQGDEHTDTNRCLKHSEMRSDGQQKHSAFTKLSGHSASFCAPRGEHFSETVSIKATEATRGNTASSTTNIFSSSSISTSKSSFTASSVAEASTAVNKSLSASTLTSNSDCKNNSSTTKLQSKSDNNNNDNSNSNNNNNNGTKPQNKTDSGDTCYEFDISTSSEGEQQSSHDNILSKVRASLNLDPEAQHTVDSRATTRRKRLLCRRCKKLGAHSVHANPTSDDATGVAEELGAVAAESRKEENFAHDDDDCIGFMVEDGMCPHLSLKYGELRAILDNMFVDQRAAILDCLTDRSSDQNPYNAKVGHDLHLALSEIGSAHLLTHQHGQQDQACRECGSEILTSDSESVTTVYSSLQLSQLVTSTGGGAATHSPSCDSDDGTMADNSGESCDDDDHNGDNDHPVSYNDIDKTGVGKKNTHKNGCAAYVDCKTTKATAALTGNSPDLMKHHKTKHYKRSVSSSNNYSTQNVYDDVDDNNSSGYDEPEEQHPPRPERSTHRTKKKEKRERKSSSAHLHTLSCTCQSETRSARRPASQVNAPPQASRPQQCAACVNDNVLESGDITPQDGMKTVDGTAGMRRSGAKKSSSTCTCSPPHGHRHSSHRHRHSHQHQPQESSQSGVGSGFVSEKALKDIYAPLPARALSLLTSRQSTNNSSDNNSIVSNSSSATNSSSNLAGTGLPCCACGGAGGTAGKSLTQQIPSSSASSSSSSASPFTSHVPPPSTTPASNPPIHKANEAPPRTKDPGSPLYSVTRETDSDKGVLNEHQTNETSDATSRRDSDNRRSEVVKVDAGNQPKPSDNVFETGSRVNPVQSHLAQEGGWDKTKEEVCVSHSNGVGSDGSLVFSCCAVAGSCSGGMHKCQGTSGEGGVTCNLCSSDGGKSRQENQHHHPHPHPHPHHHHHHSDATNMAVCAVNKDEDPEYSSLLSGKNTPLLSPPALFNPTASSSSSVSFCHPSPGCPGGESEENKKEELLLREKSGFGRAVHCDTKEMDVVAQKHGLASSSCVSGRDGDNTSMHQQQSKQLGQKFQQHTETWAATNKNSSNNNNNSSNNKDEADKAPNTKMVEQGRNSEERPQKSAEPALSEPETMCRPIAGIPTVGQTRKPPTSTGGTTGETAVNRPQQDENHCSYPAGDSACDRPDHKLHGDTPAQTENMQNLKEPSQAPSSSSFCSRPGTTCSTSSSVTPGANSPALKTKSLIPRKVKLELATLDLLPETALGGDEAEVEKTEVSSQQYTSKSSEPPTVKSREGATRCNMVQKMARLFEENATTNHGSDKTHGDSSRNTKTSLESDTSCPTTVNLSTRSPGVQKASAREWQAACTVSATISAGKPDVKPETGAFPTGLVQASAVSALQPPPQRAVTPGERSPGLPRNKISTKADEQHLNLNEKSLSLTSAVPRARPRSKPAPNTFSSADCDSEGRGGPNPGKSLVSQNKANTSGAFQELVIKEQGELSTAFPTQGENSGGKELEITSKDGCSRTRLDEEHTNEENEEHERIKRPVLERPRATKPRGSKLEHKDLLLRLEHAKERRAYNSGTAQQLLTHAGDSSSSSSPPSSKKTAGSNASAAADGAVQNSDGVQGVGVASQLPHSQQHPGKQKRYSKKSSHKRRSKSRSERRRGDGRGRAGGDKEERTYYYFSSDLSDIDVVEVDDWETYTTSMAANKHSHHGGNQQKNSSGKKITGGVVASKPHAESKMLAAGSPSQSATKGDVHFDASSSDKPVRKVRSSRDYRDSGGKTVGKSDKTSWEINADRREGKVSKKEEMKISSTIPSATLHPSPSSSPQASPELSKPSRRSACASGGSGSSKTNKMEVYKTKRSNSNTNTNNNKLLSDLIIRNYDMQIYGNV